MKSFRFFNSLFILFVGITAFTNVCFAQSQDSLKLDKLSFHVDALSFFRNTEYFNEFIDGYTLPGFWIEPKIQFQSNKTILSVGANFLKLGGDQGFKKVYPVLTAQQQLAEGFTAIVGTLNGRDKHNLPQPLYRYDNLYDGSPEYGLQLLFDYQKIKGDVWINWEQFIETGDTIQERFTQGMNWNIEVHKSENVTISIPVVSMFMHRGGQINTKESYIQTLWNNGTGIAVNVPLQGSVFQYIEFSSMLFKYKDLSPSKREAYKSGNAFMPQITLGIHNWKIDAGAWFSSHFLTPRGVGLYSSASLKTPGFTKPYRSLAYTTANYERAFHNGLTAKASAEAYFDLDSKKLDYCYGISLLFDRNFFLTYLK